ncbi:MAG: monofunctional biosynthetic peptidoglycan transglycosylase [Melioribacter sp.]|nr:monofunctional biosynthetic peptidoglycan transglycosylase [Melioribacter sp.]
MNDKSLPKRIFGVVKQILLVPLIFILYNVLVTIVFRVIDPASTAFIYQNIENPIGSLFSSADIKYKPVSIENVSFYLPLAVIASEDQKFFDHFGFDFEQIEKAMKENTYRKRKRGASTVSMQVAKNLFLWSERNLIRKGFEAYYTLLLELLWSKKRIIETYLNIAEMGKGIYGASSASNFHFKKSPSKLTIAESATIAAILPNPKKRNPAKPSGYIISRRDDIIRQMNLLGGKSYLIQEFK